MFREPGIGSALYRRRGALGQILLRQSPKATLGPPSGALSVTNRWSSQAKLPFEQRGMLVAGLLVGEATNHPLALEVGFRDEYLPHVNLKARCLNQ